jgi:hypothetical protein
MNYQLLQERLAIAHAEIERLLESMLGEALPALPAIGVNEPWHREYLRVARILEALRRLEAASAAAPDTGDPAPRASRKRARS